MCQEVSYCFVAISLSLLIFTTFSRQQTFEKWFFSVIFLGWIQGQSKANIISIHVLLSEWWCYVIEAHKIRKENLLLLFKCFMGFMRIFESFLWDFLEMKSYFHSIKDDFKVETHYIKRGFIYRGVSINKFS